ncbi:MAG: HAD-IIIC family phosphatase [Dehalococcoidia bacterium]
MTMTTQLRPTTIATIPWDLGPAQYQRIARQLAAAPAPGLSPLRLGMLASYTLDFLRPVVTVEAARVGFTANLYLGDFGQLEQPVLDPGSSLHAFAPELLVLLFQPADLVPSVFDRFYSTGGSELDAVCGDLIERLVATARAFRAQAGRSVLVANFALPPQLPLGPFDAGDPRGLTHRLGAHNLALAERLAGEPDVYVWDYAGLVREVGTAAWSDPRVQLLARMAVASRNQPSLVRHLLRTIVALRRPPAKCLVLDLDNTIWGGVIGDDGPEGIKLGDDWPGNAYKAFQRCALGLRDRGILLAVASKNDEPVAAQVFRNHPEMLIRWEDLAAVRINWETKGANIRAIAQELNIGADSLVLFDDNPVERAEVRATAPEVRVIEVPADPTAYRDALLMSGHFDQSKLSAEDRERAGMYQVERERAILRQDAPTVADFLRSLDMEAEIGEVDGDTMARVAQLIGKTNQFNLTTRRHSPAEVARLGAADDSVVAWLRLRDRFGDQGLVAVGIIEKRATEAWLDTFLMSCRVMNREVEHAMMAYLIEHAMALGCERLIGEYRPTPKNHMVAELLPGFGFASRDQHDGGLLWECDLSAPPVSWPAHIRRIEAAVNVAAAK